MIETSQSHSFSSFGFKEPILKAILDMGFSKPTEVQEKTMPAILEGLDLVAQSQTGSGKTAAFALPSLNQIEDKSLVSMLVITPTRELAQQVSEEICKLGKASSITSVAIYGGQSASYQIKQVKRGVQVIVATPGRLLDLLQSKKLKNFSPSIVVLDEADEMLDMGFLDDINEIFTFLPSERQTLLFSATMPKPIQKLAKKILKEPLFINTIKEASHQDIQEYYYLIKENEREHALIRLMDAHLPGKSIVFCRTKSEVDKLFSSLSSLGYKVKSLHGDMEQNQRRQAIDSFKKGDSSILVATDVAGRGLNVLDVSHVINYHMPYSSVTHTHRIGRTGRAGRKGTGITLISTSEFNKAQRILNLKKNEITLSPIPTKKDVSSKRDSQLMEKIKTHDTSPSSDILLEKLQKEMDLTQIGLNLLSMLLDKEQISGPDKIGAETKDLLKNRSSSYRQRNHSRGFKSDFKRAKRPYKSQGFRKKGASKQPRR